MNRPRVEMAAAPRSGAADSDSVARACFVLSSLQTDTALAEVRRAYHSHTQKVEAEGL